MKSIAIDGPAGAGKSTIAREVAKRLNYIYVDTGAMYRAMALYFLRQKVDVNDGGQLEAACDCADVTIAYAAGEQQVILNGENVNGLIRTSEVSDMASRSSTNRKVREKMVELQRKLAERENVVMDGRDIGTFVLPNAETKIYLTASTKERARRRFEEYKAKGQEADLAAIEKEIEERDYRDMNREFAPLRQAEDAVYLDTSDMSIEEVQRTVIALAMK